MDENPQYYIERKLIANSDIVELSNKPAGSVSEEDLKTVLRRYNLRDGLIALGKISNQIFSGGPNNIGRAIYREPKTGILISQFALSYLANILLISGSNDYKSKKYLSEKDNLLALCNIYNNCLIQPELTESDRLTNMDRFRSFMVRMDPEQIKFQFTPGTLIARTIIIFDDLINKKPPQRFASLSKIFEEKTGLSIHDYLKLVIVAFAGILKMPTLRISMFTKANINKIKDVLTDEKVIKFLNILRADYKTFREEDNRLNKDLNPIFTKTRFNPLGTYPIIETDEKRLGDPFVVPNVSLYIKKAFGGLYWWFHRYFENTSQQLDFRAYFGDVFEDYVGLILRSIYGEQNVHPEVRYSKDRKFIDWWVERGDNIYLFEVKAYQFALQSWQTGDRESIVKTEIKKIVDAIEQVYERIQDIHKYEELSRFRNKRIIPLIVFMDMPFISSDLYDPWIRDALEEMEKEKQPTKLENFPIFRLNIEELELFDEAVDKIELKDVYQVLKNDPRKDFLSVVAEAKGSKLGNRFLDKTYEDFCKEIVSVACSKEEH